jgi:D-3-phosphoglycerate dehydrogenase
MTTFPALYIDRSIPDGLDDLFSGRADIVGPDPAALAEADGVIAGAATWDGERMDGATDRLKVISRSGIGYDGVDLKAATERGLVVCNAPEAPTVSTAEHAVALLLAAAKRIPVNQQKLRDAAGDYFETNDAIELDGRTLGLVAYGRIARRVGAVAAALGMRVVTHDPYLDEADVDLVDFDSLLEQSDVISVHAPLTPDTRRMFDATAFAAMRPGVVFVNAARGGLVDQEALLIALGNGQVFAAALDVTDPEPLAPEHPLLSHPDVIVTPHIASATDRGKRRLFDHAIENALAVIAGDRPATVVNPEVYDR